MNLSQAKTQLEKIIALYKSMSADEKNISTIERDLMLSYIRSLYENFLDATPSVYSNIFAAFSTGLAIIDAASCETTFDSS